MTCPRCAELERLLRELVEACEDDASAGSCDFIHTIVRVEAVTKKCRAYLATAPEPSPIRETVEIADHGGTL